MSKTKPEWLLPLRGGVAALPPARTCQWPFGDPGAPDFHFCGRKSFAGFSYCEEHAAMAYRPVEPRRNVA